MIKIYKIDQDIVEAILYMKKALGYSFLVFSFYCILSNFLVKKELLPEDTLRMRVIANSNQEYDQKIKWKVKVDLEKELYQLLKDTKGIEHAKQMVEENTTEINQKVERILEKEHYPFSYQINYGKNYFPEKKYKGVVYEEGYYDSLVVTLGKGHGENFWCVMYPPLCLVEDTSEVEYKMLVQELIEKYM